VILLAERFKYRTGFGFQQSGVVSEDYRTEDSSDILYLSFRAAGAVYEVEQRNCFKTVKRNSCTDLNENHTRCIEDT
jgi:hypothetical protein